LGVWAYKHIHGWEDDIFKITPMAIDINDQRSLHVAQLVRDALRNMGQPIAAADILLMGASYREDVGDTRYSGSELIVRRLTEMGADVRAHDPYVAHWFEFKNQEVNAEHDGDFAPHSKAEFFNRQRHLKDLEMQPDLKAAMKGAKAIILAVRHSEYLELEPDKVVKAVGRPCAIIDCFCILTDEQIQRYFELGCEVKGMGRGHIRRIKKKVLSAKK